jgi:hypothetical protein
VGWPIAKGGNRRDQNHARQISVASAPVGQTVCDAVHNGRRPDRRPRIEQTSGNWPATDDVARAQRRAGRFHDRAARVRLSLTIFKQLAGEIGSGRFFSNRRSDDMIEPDVLSSEIGVLMALQRDAWRELASPELTQFDRREIRNRIRQGEVDLRGFLQLRTERLRFQPRPAEAPIDSLATINFRFF